MLTKALPPELKCIEAAASGLSLQSETDAPLEVFWWVLRGESMEFMDRLEHSGSVRMQGVDSFFAPLVETESWMSADEVTQCERLAELRDAVKANLQEPRVYRVDGDVTIIGGVSIGVGGLRTKVVET